MLRWNAVICIKNVVVICKETDINFISPQILAHFNTFSHIIFRLFHYAGIHTQQLPVPSFLSFPSPHASYTTNRKIIGGKGFSKISQVCLLGFTEHLHCIISLLFQSSKCLLNRFYLSKGREGGGILEYQLSSYLLFRFLSLS